MFDLIIQNGKLLDPRRGLNEEGDIGICGQTIAGIGNLSGCSAQQYIDATGCYVTPGFIDFHAHAAYRISDFSMPADVIQLPNGVTSMVDAGSAGAANYEAFHCYSIVNSILAIKSFLHVASVGQLTHKINENPDPALFDRERIAALCQKYQGEIIGLKLRQSRNIVGELGFKPLEGAVALGEELGLRLSVHITDSPGKVSDTLDRLRPGDIFCHMYHQAGNTILDDCGKVRSEIWAARERGVLFELGHGAFNFSGKIAKAAFSEGFFPDIISSDLSLLSAYKSPTHSFAYILSELLNLGMPLEDIITRCTDIPAAMMGINHDGFLKEGRPADIAVFKLIEKPVSYLDRYGNHYTGDRLLQPQVTVKNGMVVFRQVTI